MLLFAGLFMGWSLGTNDSANAFGSAVAAGVVRHRTAAVIIAVMVLLGAAVEGERNLEAISELSAVNKVSAAGQELCESENAGASSLSRLHGARKAALIYACAGAAVFLMSVLRLPVSANQSIAGAVMGWGLCRADYADPAVRTAGLTQAGRFLSAWLFSPLTAGAVAYLLVRCFGPLLRRKATHNRHLLPAGYLIAGACAAYSIGANSAAPVMALYYHSSGGLLTDGRAAAMLGGAAIALGALTYSGRVMETVGGGVTAPDPCDGFMVVLAMSAAVTGVGRCLGIPVSTSEAVVGAALGAGLTRGIGAVRFGVLRRIGLAWVCSPVMAGALSCVAANLTREILP